MNITDHCKVVRRLQNYTNQRPMERTMNRRVLNLTLLSAVLWLTAAADQAPTRLRINGPRLNAHLSALAEFGKNPQGGVSRIAYTDADKASRPYLMQLLREAKLDVSVVID